MKVGGCDTRMYELARGLVREGEWRVDAERGVIYGKRGTVIGSLNSWGYVQVVFYHAGRRYMPVAHRVVWESVNGPADPAMEMNHLNGVKSDNRIENLELVTCGDNQRHAFRTGLKQPLTGERNRMAKLSEVMVREVRSRLDEGERQCEVAAAMGLTRFTVSRIANRLSWKDVA